MTPPPDSLYDIVPYRSLPVADAHPDRLATLACLFGVRPAPLETCRVLELGCGDGAHLIPVALMWPGSRCVGVDLARAPVAAGRALAAGLGLQNLTLHQLDLRELDAGFGQFDYIVAHGLYSWVPPATRDKLLGICAANLAPNGVAFVSYNTYPGCHLRDMMREMMLYQTRSVSSPELKLKHAYALVNFLASAGPETAALAEELRTLQSRLPSSLFHDDLAETNQPVYFHQFVEHAGRHGLEYLAEAEFKAVSHGGFSEQTVRALKLVSGGDRIQEQQYLDFLRCRRFRQTLLVRQGTAPRDEPDPRAVVNLLAAGSLKPVSEPPDIASDAELEFRSAAGQSVKTNLPLAKAVLCCLSGRWPAAEPFQELAGEAGRMLGQEPPAEEPLAKLLLRLCMGGAVELHAVPSRFTTAVAGRPRAFSLARWQAGRGLPLTTMRHTTVELEDDLSRRMVTLLDGSRDLPALRRDLEAFAAGRGLHGAVRPGDLERNLSKMALLAVLEA